MCRRATPGNRVSALGAVLLVTTNRRIHTAALPNIKAVESNAQASRSTTHSNTRKQSLDGGRVVDGNRGRVGGADPDGAKPCLEERALDGE